MKHMKTVTQAAPSKANILLWPKELWTQIHDAEFLYEEDDITGDLIRNGWKANPFA